MVAQGDGNENSLMEVALSENYMGQQAPPICGNYTSIPQILGGNPSTVEVILNPESLEVTLNPEALDVSLTHQEAKLVSPDAPISCYGAALNTSAETRTGILQSTSKIELAHSSVPEVHLEVQSPSDLCEKVDEQEESAHMRNEGDAEEVSANIESVPDLSFKSSSLVYVSDFTEDSDNVHEADERKEGGNKEQKIKNRILNIPIRATDQAALENESLDRKVQPKEVRDEIEDFDEKVALVKAKLDLDSSEEAKAVEAVMAGFNEKYFQSGGVVGRIELDEKEEKQEKVVVDKHVQELPQSEEVASVEANLETSGCLETGDAGLDDGKVDGQEEVERHVLECIESVIEQGRGEKLFQALEDDVEEGRVDVGLKAKRKLRRQRCSRL